MDHVGFKEVFDPHRPKHPLDKPSNAERAMALILTVLSGRVSAAYGPAAHPPGCKTPDYYRRSTALTRPAPTKSHLRSCWGIRSRCLRSRTVCIWIRPQPVSFERVAPRQWQGRPDVFVVLQRVSPLTRTQSPLSPGLGKWSAAGRSAGHGLSRSAVAEGASGRSTAHSTALAPVWRRGTPRDDPSASHAHLPTTPPHRTDADAGRHLTESDVAARSERLTRALKGRGSPR